MEAVLTNIGTLLELAASSDSGRKIIMELCSALQIYTADKALPIATTDAETEATAARAYELHTDSIATTTVENTASLNFPQGYTIIHDAITKITKDMDTINDIIDINKRFVEINKLYGYIMYTVPGVLLFSEVKKTITSKIDSYITQLETNYRNIPQSWKYITEFGLMKIYLKMNRSVRFSWYDNGTRITVVQTASGGFKEIRRGDLTGKKLLYPSKWENFDALQKYWAMQKYWSEDDLTIKHIATSYGN
jgi:hypothetical protein